MVAALDVAVVKGIAGADLYVDFKSDGEMIKTIVKKGRGINLALDVKRPLITNYSVSCCCIQFLLYVDGCRNSGAGITTRNGVVVKWDLMYDKDALFARDITEDKEI